MRILHILSRMPHASAIEERAVKPMHRAPFLDSWWRAFCDNAPKRTDPYPWNVSYAIGHISYTILRPARAEWRKSPLDYGGGGPPEQSGAGP